MKKVLWAATVIIILWVAGSFYVLSQAPKSLFVPAQRDRSKQVINLPAGFQRDFVRNQAGQNIEIITIPNPASPDVIAYFHGNSGRIPEIIAQASTMATVVSPSYPGYSQSEGEPTKKNVYETADLAMQYVADKGYDRSRVTVLGHSLGGTAAVYAGAHYSGLHRVILVNTLNSVISLCWPKYYILCTFTENYFNSGKLAERIAAPTRVFHDEADAVVPYEQGKRLFDAVGGSDKQFETLAGTHSMFDVMTVLRE